MLQQRVTPTGSPLRAFIHGHDPEQPPELPALLLSSFVTREGAPLSLWRCSCCLLLFAVLMSVSWLL